MNTRQINSEEHSFDNCGLIHSVGIKACRFLRNCFGAGMFLTTFKARYSAVLTNFPRNHTKILTVAAPAVGKLYFKWEIGTEIAVVLN